MLTKTVMGKKSNALDSKDKESIQERKKVLIPPPPLFLSLSLSAYIPCHYQNLQRLYLL